MPSHRQISAESSAFRDFPHNSLNSRPSTLDFMGKAYDGSGAIDLGEIIHGIKPPELEVPSAAVSSDSLNSRPSSLDLFAEKVRKAWAHNDGARCDFQSRPMLAYRTGLFFLSVWKRSVYGKTLSEIKADDLMIPKVANATASLLSDVLGGHLNHGGWAVITTPKRRHLQRNFASLVADRVASILSVPFMPMPPRAARSSASTPSLN